MKTNVLLLFLLLAVAPTFSQNSWTWGVLTEVGISGQKEYEMSKEVYNTTSYEDLQYRERRQAIGGGLWVEYQLSQRFVLRSGLQYMNVGEKNGYVNSSSLVSTQQQTNYSAQAYDVRIDRYQLPFIASLKLRKGKIQPTIGVGVVLSKDRVNSIYDERYSRSYDQMIANIPEGFPSNARQNTIQPLANIGAKLSEHLMIEIQHLFAVNPWSFSWTPDYEQEFHDTPGIIICFLPITYSTKINYQQQTSLVLRYGF